LEIEFENAARDLEDCHAQFYWMDEGRFVFDRHLFACAWRWHGCERAGAAGV
jgi:hypothetical protein